MKYYKAKYGCYLGYTEVGVKSQGSKELVEDAAYEQAYQATESWLGSQGLECVEGDECFGGDCCHQTIEEAAVYVATECTKEEYLEYGESHHGFEEW